MSNPQSLVRGRSACADPSWRTLYRLGSVAAALYVLLVLVPVVLIYLAPLAPTEGAAVLKYIADHSGVYLIELVCFVGLAVPALLVFTALTVALWPVDKSLAAIGGLFGVASEIIALALSGSPQSLHGGLVVLSNSYTAAETETRRTALVSAAESLIAATNAVSWGGILTAAGILVLSLVMRRASFGTRVAVVGIITGAAGIVSEVLRPIIGGGYLLYGLLLPTWFALIGWQLHRLATPPPVESEAVRAGLGVRT